ncbi:copper resistance protein NlpE N-terminal domain-containing protein [Rhodohalobacter sp. 614A]|uniref:copper resistance protein NlpE N-terminal domain-containing protein n=1 Tax=Rhodohalobacter sp. 614A TaxID=2908649 RepID=UPI001F333884|nr:copper resistance protein NlpE N-terminal domain-containing protein [Rhodohalobacter sp. 614A]
MKQTVYFRIHLLFIISIICGFAVISCDTNGQLETSENNSGNEKLPDINLPAMYTGTIPCADCPGIDYHLIIEKDQFIEILRYQERSPSAFEGTGTWKIDGDTLTLLQPNNENFGKKFLIGPQTLTFLDNNNQPIRGNLSEMYVLERTGDQSSIHEHHQKLAKQGFTFYAGGNEPFWSVKMDSMNNFIFETPDSSQHFEKTDSTRNTDQIIFEGNSDSGQITIQVMDNYCQDSMSGYLFPQTVSVVLAPAKTDTLAGCGLFLDR